MSEESTRFFDGKAKAVFPCPSCEDDIPMTVQFSIKAYNSSEGRTYKGEFTSTVDASAHRECAVVKDPETFEKIVHDAASDVQDDIAAQVILDDRTQGAVLQ